MDIDTAISCLSCDDPGNSRKVLYHVERRDIEEDEVSKHLFEKILLLGLWSRRRMTSREITGQSQFILLKLCLNVKSDFSSIKVR